MTATTFAIVMAYTLGTTTWAAFELLYWYERYPPREVRIRRLNAQIRRAADRCRMVSEEMIEMGASVEVFAAALADAQDDLDLELTAREVAALEVAMEDDRTEPEGGERWNRET